MESLIKKELKKHGIDAKITITSSFVDFEVPTAVQACELKAAFENIGVKEVNFFSLEEIGETGFMVEVRF